MRSQSPEKKQIIVDFINSFYDKNRRSPALMDIENATGISRQTALRYLRTMNEDGVLEYDGKKIITKHIHNLLSRDTVRLLKVGLIPCGEFQSEEEIDGEFIEFPCCLLGEKGKYYVLTANGDSMINAGINDGDLIIIRQTTAADFGQIIVALDENNRNTLKRYCFNKEQGRVYLHPENNQYKDMYPDEIKIQGVAEKIIKDLI